MRAILMAAGMGTRISSETNKPKSLLPLRNESIIHHTVRMLQKHGIKVCVVLGYKKQYLIDELNDMDVDFVVNPFYRVTNSIASLYLARNFLDDDVILANADVYWDEDILNILLSNHDDVMMLADSSRVEEGDYFFKVENGVLKDYGKELKLSDRNCEYVGIAKINKNFIKDFKKQLVYLVENEEYNYWWENVLYSICDKKAIPVVDVYPKFWGEVDTKADYQRILNYINKK